MSQLPRQDVPLRTHEDGFPEPQVYPFAQSSILHFGGIALVIKKEKIQSIIKSHKSLKKNLIAILLDIQAAYNYLPPESLRLVASGLGIPLIDAIGVATFFRAFSLTPRGKHTCLVCLGTACHVRGGPKILDEFERQLDVRAGETTKDGQFTLETLACLGCCAIGPVVVIDKEYHGHATVRKVGTILNKYRKPRRRGARTQKSRSSRSATP
jgi:NADH-quinone oxidoreductase subunit E